MNCSRCATELADNATFCTKCGLSTTPSLARSFSYLPPGTPPWPTSVPALIPYVVDSKAAPLTVTPPAKTEGKGGSQVLAGIVVLLLVPLLGAFATFGILYANGKVGAPLKTTAAKTSATSTAIPSLSQTPSNVLPTPVALKSTDANMNSALKASMEYPSDWQVGPIDQSTTNVIDLPMISTVIGIRMYIERLLPGAVQDGATAKEINQFNLQSLAQQGATIQQVASPNAMPTIGGTQWDQSDATFANSNNIQVHYTTITVKRGTDYYMIEMVVPTGIYQEAWTKYIQPMLATFKFLP